MPPSTAIAMNHTVVTGPNSAETLAVPRDCMANRATRMTTVTGST